MTREEWKEKVERAVETHHDGSPDVFLYSLFDFSFDYDVEAEEVRLQAPVSELMYNPVGFIHGGVITYIADTCMGHLCAAFNERPSVSLELKTQFLRTAKSGSLHARAYFLKKGKGVQYVECTIENDKGELLSKISGTFYTLQEGS
ncbi:PaaI family thioesterase [Alkalicoccus halolimnae]|uniref:PaaI family thioesterase n=1 Tax=Alkalicoccus halolimnae TaxID=1667239 RepID=A0A5C7FMD8_9BACI|nr:PaaI family thioesterase [Alkalicoccus halolimnae]TXF86546.1 PaaI family thioesterase [Alkalicoccus halolimnae]